MVTKKMIQKRGLKLCWVAEQIGVERTLLSRYLNGNRPMPKKVNLKLANLLAR